MGHVRHGSATTTHAVRAAIQRSQASLATLSRELGIDPKTVAKWRKRATVEDLKTGPKAPHSTTLTEAEEAMVVAFWLHTLLPLDDCRQRHGLGKRFLPSTSLDIGVRTSLVTGLSYFGILAALLSATNMLGVQLEKVKLIASALSVGIGFGLQSIIQNFVSGVILLIERPVKPGDWVAVSGAEGTIRRIRVRATELATADGGTAIVPNSSFISGNVSNQGGTRMSDRLDLTLTIGGCPNAAAARQAVLDIVKGDLPVRPDPAPELCLTTLGDGEWIFDLRVFVKPGISPRQARSEILLSLAAQSDGRDLKIKGA